MIRKNRAGGQFFAACMPSSMFRGVQPASEDKVQSPKASSKDKAQSQQKRFKKNR